MSGSHRVREERDEKRDRGVLQLRFLEGDVAIKRDKIGRFAGSMSILVGS